MSIGVVHKKYLDQLKNDRIPIVLYTINGFQFHGVLCDYDEDGLCIHSRGVNNWIYRHAVSTISPEGIREVKV